MLIALHLVQTLAAGENEIDLAKKLFFECRQVRVSALEC
jgi:hypothetical protein